MKERNKRITVTERTFNTLVFVRDQHAERGGGVLGLGAMLQVILNKALGVEPRLFARGIVGLKGSPSARPQVGKTKRKLGRRKS